MHFDAASHCWLSLNVVMTDSLKEMKTSSPAVLLQHINNLAVSPALSELTLLLCLSPFFHSSDRGLPGLPQWTSYVPVWGSVLYELLSIWAGIFQHTCDECAQRKLQRTESAVFFHRFNVQYNISTLCRGGVMNGWWNYLSFWTFSI